MLKSAYAPRSLYRCDEVRERGIKGGLADAVQDDAADVGKLVEHVIRPIHGEIG